MIDYYKVLNVSPDASPEAIKEQRLFLVNAFHPDKFSGAGEKSRAKAEEKTKEINAAYDVLKNPTSRGEYDRQRAAEKERLRASVPPPAPAPTARPAAKPPTPTPAKTGVDARPQEEELIKNCLEIIRETGQASASLFQRRFRIGYTRAARLIETLESRGYIGPDRGSSEREVLIDLGRRASPSPSPPPPASVSSAAVKSLEEETRRLRAEQLRLETQLRLQQIATPRPSVRTRRAPLTNFGCLQGCGCLVLAMVGLVFLLGVSRSCTRSASAPTSTGVESPFTQQIPGTPPSSRNADSPVPVRRALPLVGTTPPYSGAGTALPEMYSVVGIDRNDTLNVHNGPGSNYQVIAKLPNGYQDVQVVGTSVTNGTTEWVQINFRNQSGWVAKAYLKAQ